MEIQRRQFLRMAAGTAALPAVSRIAQAQAYPTRPVRWIVPSAPGGLDDTFARLIAPHMSSAFGRQFFVENVPGGSGTVGLGRAARSSPDGYTIVSVNHISYVVSPVLFKSAPYELKDLSPITFAAQTTQVLVVNPSLPVQTAADLVSLIKANPGKLAYATPGFGSAGAMVGELFRHSLGLDLIQVPFNGAGPAIGSTVAGHTMIAFGSPAATVPQIKADRLRALAVATKKRLVTLPDIPTMAQAGFSDIEGDVWEAVLVPSGTPDAIVERLHREIAAIITLPEIGARFEEFGLMPSTSTSEEAADIARVESARWARVIQAAGSRPSS